ncbi:MAG TPA: glycerol-3-phosphate dehydrogenase/oxidase [Gammaproteobacteria bacterium]|nr:glycerol-3-phosphate dehydrogenase/oxidase [Gammaproteobacteria bacterium]
MELRDTNLKRLESEDFDVLIVGGGINGAVSAAALAARDVRVALIDARDFAGFTSQQSSNLVWGGIKYMEGYEFGLVAGLCRSRNELLKSFPSTVKEIRFLMTLNRQFRFHPLVILASTWLYWLLGRGQTRTPRRLGARQLKKLEPMVNTRDSAGGIEYSDAFLHDNDARFVFNFVRSAMNRGCVAANYVASLGATRYGNHWRIQAENRIDGRRFEIRAKVLINAAGPFVDAHNQLAGIETRHCHLLSKGIHLIVPRISESRRVLAFFADDERLFFAIPMANRTCIGTTDTRVDDPVTEVTDADRDFVLSNINARLDLPRPLSRADIIAERCGVRPLAIPKSADSSADVQHLSRKHVIEIDEKQSHISIFGGKLTDCLNVGDEVSEAVAGLGLAVSEPAGKWYGEPGERERAEFFRRARALGIDAVVAGDTGEALSERLWRRYAADAITMLDAIAHDSSLCDPLVDNAGIRRCEIDYLAKHEMIVKLEDYLRRRSKIELLYSREELRQSAGLFEACERLFGAEAKQRFDEYFAELPAQ